MKFKEFIYKKFIIFEINYNIYIGPKCGKHIDRDYNAALNILDEGLKQIL